MLELLILNGAKINEKTSQMKYYERGRGGQTPLHHILEGNCPKEMLELLISKGADINIGDISYQIINKVLEL